MADHAFLTPADMLEHWEGHRRLTRRIIDACPDDQFATFSIGGMRTFAELASEISNMAGPMVRGLATGNYDGTFAAPTSKREVLEQLDADTALVKEYWEQVPGERWHETVTSFGQYTGTGHWQMLYVTDNEIHHRGQLYVYLRAMGVAPTPFYER